MNMNAKLFTVSVSCILSWKKKKLCYEYIMKYSFSTRIKSIPLNWLISSGILPRFPHPTVHRVELHVRRPSCQYVPERPGDPLLFGVRFQLYHRTPPCSLGSSLLFWTKLPPDARFLDMDIKRIRSERRGEECLGWKEKKKKKPSLLQNHHLP